MLKLEQRVLKMHLKMIKQEQKVQKQELLKSKLEQMVLIYLQMPNLEKKS